MPGPGPGVSVASEDRAVSVAWVAPSEDRAVSVASVVSEDRAASVVSAGRVASVVSAVPVASAVSEDRVASVAPEGVPDGDCFSNSLLSEEPLGRHHGAPMIGAAVAVDSLMDDTG